MCLLKPKTTFPANVFENKLGLLNNPDYFSFRVWDLMGYLSLVFLCNKARNMLVLQQWLAIGTITSNCLNVIFT